MVESLEGGEGVSQEINAIEGGSDAHHDSIA